MVRRGFKPPQTQRGLAMVELAIALPLLLLLLFALGEFGRLLFQYNSLTQACRDAGRFVAGEAWNATLGKVELSSDLQSRTRNLAVYGTPATVSGASSVVPGLTTGDVSVTDITGTGHVQVSITYTFRPVIGSVLPGFYGNSVPLGIDLTSTVVMRAL
ncbi:TadE/TadG family type IV pilus assembly protein [Pseudomonas fluorescens]|uniref:TadE-like domain-containing protein n=1 Tax=Pseudomonas fluorescens TaxID=294 RepID=A0A5E7DJ45_PSEFL|nr:TadE/TadG family type IV pilus assembly protein [Pseudomonas fluorescens]VVO17590.1 hypothetical protein PS723_03936 [Pseudomonas fluorescens]